jgi:ATP-dependent RNA helicase DDX52/ROK1
MDPLKLLSRSTGLSARGGSGSRASVQQCPYGQALPASATVPEKEAAQGAEPHLGKKKRDEAESVSPEDARAVLKRYKIKVTDLSALQKARSKSGSKPQKDHFRVYPRPVTSFSQLRGRLNVHGGLAENLADQGYADPTEVQMASLPLLLSTDSPPDLLTVAPTGSGKTLAFLIPLIQGILRARSNDDSGTHTAANHQASAIILAPTKELVGQIVNEGRKLTARTGVTISVVRKGMQIAGLSQVELHDEKSSESDAPEKPNGRATSGAVRSDILVSTPLALLNAIDAGEEAQAASLPHIQHLVLDEADVLLDPLFRSQTLTVWKACNHPRLQVSLWSATMGSNIEELAMRSIHEYQAESRKHSQHQVLRCVVGLKDSAVSSISHRMVYAATEPGKLLGLRDLLHPRPKQDDKKQQPLRPPFLVFTQTIERATALYSELLYDIPSEAGGLERVAVLHSDLSDTKRADVMTSFRNGRVWVLITTDLLSRGVDFRGVNGVVNYDIPTTTAAYVHRAGRTGRAGRQGGIAVTFYTKDDIKYVKGIANVIAAGENAKGSEVGDAEGLEKWVLDALPDISKNEKKELRQRGVQARRGVREGDDEKAVRAKRKARIGTKSGYEIQKEKNRKGAIEASRRHPEADDEVDDDSEWSGV